MSRKSLPAIPLFALLLAVALSLLALALPAEDTHGFRILSAESRVRNDMAVFDADVALRFSDEVLEALDNGVPITVAFEAEVKQRREYIWDKTIAERSWLFQLRYHSLTQRHEIIDLATGDLHSYRARHAALIALGQVHGLPLIDTELLDPQAGHLARLRVGIDIEALPAPLRLPAYLSAQWDLDSDWYEWPLAVTRDDTDR